MWSRKSAMLGSLAVAMYLLGLTLRNSQLVTIAVVIFVFLTWAALFGGHADVAASGRRAEEWSGEEGVSLSNVSAMRKLSSARIFEDGEVGVTLRMQNHSALGKILEVKDRVPEVMRIKDGANYILMELGPRRETFIEYTVECPLRGFYSLGPVAVRVQDPFGLFHKEKELHVYNDFLVFPKMEDLKDTFVKSKVPKIFTGAVNIRQPGPGSEFYSLREYFEGDSFRAINWSAYARSGKLMVNERERDAVSDIILIVDSRAVSETGPVSRNALVYSTRAAASLGSDPVNTFMKITLPLILPGVISGGLFAFVTSFDEVVVVLFLAGLDNTTIPIQMWTGLREQLSPTILAVATCLIILSTLILVTAELLRRRSARIRGINR